MMMMGGDIEIVMMSNQGCILELMMVDMGLSKDTWHFSS